MKSIKDIILEYVKSEETKKDLYSIVEPIRESIYNELYPYLLFICIYVAVITFIIDLVAIIIYYLFGWFL